MIEALIEWYYGLPHGVQVLIRYTQYILIIYAFIILFKIVLYGVKQIKRLFTGELTIKMLVSKVFAVFKTHATVHPWRGYLGMILASSITMGLVFFVGLVAVALFLDWILAQ